MLLSIRDAAKCHVTTVTLKRNSDNGNNKGTNVSIVQKRNVGN